MNEDRKPFDRTPLVKILGVKLKPETPGERPRSIRIGVDRKLAGLLGAKHFLTYDFNFRKPSHTLAQIEKILTSRGIQIPANQLVTEQLKVGGWYDDHYSFTPIQDSEGRDAYRLDYTREPRFNCMDD